jgi:uncharacterized protein DUF6916
MMGKSRRDLFRLGAAAAVAWCLPKGASAAATCGSGRAIVDDAAREAFLSADPLLTRSLLSGQVGTAFAVQGQGRRRPQLTLVSIADLPSADRTGMEGNDLCFSALFTGGKSDAALSQSTYELTHRALGTVSVFLVPVGQPGASVRYEAVFNRVEA